MLSGVDILGDLILLVSKDSGLFLLNIFLQNFSLNNRFLIMYQSKPNKYTNFVRPSSPSEARFYTLHPNISGEEAKKLYLQEVKDIGNPDPVTHEEVDIYNTTNMRRKRLLVRNPDVPLTNKDLFISAQNDDLDTLTKILDQTPEKINILDDYGWSLLMIACQANSVEAVNELLKRDIDTSIRDKAGNSAQNLVIKSKNLIIADLLISHKNNRSKENNFQQDQDRKRVKLKEEFSCDICNKVYEDKQKHLTSTIHNINASKGRKTPASYVIPSTNKGYQLMLKGGWDTESGLGPDGSGKRYPIRTVQKKDRKGLGLDKKIAKVTELDTIRKQTKKGREREYRYKKRLEAKFRREFY